MPANLDYQRAALNKRTASGGDLNGLIPHLFTNNVVPSEQTMEADLTEPTFHGYTPGAAVAFGPAYNDAQAGQAEVAAQVAPFIGADASIVETVYGVYLKTASGASPAGSSLALIKAFDAPITMSRAGNGISLDLRVGYNGELSVSVNT